MSKKIEFTTDEIFRKIDTSLEQTDRLRADNLDKMTVVQQIRTKALAKERQRLAVKYGADDRRVQRIDAQLQFTQGFTRDLKVEVDKAKIEVPTIDRNSWMVHGRVLQAKDNQGIPKLTVSLVNSEGQWVQEAGYDCTDERGYFAIIYPPKDSQSSTPQESIFLRVSDANQQILYRSNELLQVVGESIYREIFLSEETECTPPPDSATPSVPVEILSLEASTPLTVNQSGRFTARVNQDATPPITYSWDFGDKTTASTLTATHSYASAGNYNVTLTASNAGGSDSRSLFVTVSQSSSDAWTVRGRVVNEQKQGLEGLVVSLCDRDGIIFDDRLGTTQTDENGEFILTYRTEDFRDLVETKPDLYLKIMDNEGNMLYSSESAVRCEAGREEVFEICIEEGDRAS